jgi:hypothetical protein
MHVFMILVVNVHARVISWAGVCSDRLATVVIRWGATPYVCNPVERS